MVNAGGFEVRMLEDQWTAVTADGSLSAHFEHTILLSDNGPEILTRVAVGQIDPWGNIRILECGNLLVTDFNFREVFEKRKLGQVGAL